MPTLSTTNDAGSKVQEALLERRITAIVPARNEEEAIEECVRSLARQSEIAEIIVVDDQSTDGTAQLVLGLTAEIPRLQLLQTAAIPAGWVGKNHAIWEGAGHAGSPWLLLVDADAELLDGATARALQIAEETKSAVVSFSPEQRLVAWYEKALIPFVYYRLEKHFAYREVSDPHSKVAAANGQFLMIRRDVYQEIGGHRSVAGEVLEDVALARRVKATGRRIWFGSGSGVVRTRMYRSFEAMWQGWEKNLYLLVGGTPWAALRELLAALPWLSVALLLLGLRLPIAMVAGAGLLLSSHAAYASWLLRSNQFRGMNILYYMPGAALYGAVLWASYRAYAGGAVRWKGRRVAVKAAE